MPDEGTNGLAEPVVALGRAATIYDVARVAGVSHQTVSRYLSGFAGIRPHTRERVEQALQSLDYRPNRTARSLRTGRSHRILALTHEIDQFGPSKILQAASAAARQAGYVLDIIALDPDSPVAVQEALRLTRSSDCDGIIALTSTDDMAEALRGADFEAPTIIAGERDDDASAAPTELSTTGFPALIAHLAELGHRDIVHVSGPSTWSAARNRIRGLTAALTARQMPPPTVLPGDWSAASAYRAVKAALDDRPMTVVVAANDQMAVGAALAITERGLHIPDDVSLTGIDDVPEAAYYQPPLTTLRVDFRAQGHDAVRQLLAAVGGHSAPVATPQRAQLVVRASTGPARNVSRRLRPAGVR